MKVLVPVKRVIDYNVKVRVWSDGSCIDLDDITMSTNPFDEIAVEEAVCLKKVGPADEIMMVSICVKQVQETLRTAFKCLIYAGNAKKTVRTLDATKVVSVRTSTFDAAGKQSTAPIEAIAAAPNPNLSGWAEDKSAEKVRSLLRSTRMQKRQFFDLRISVLSQTCSMPYPNTAKNCKQELLT